jgi:hypothetical protein
MAEAATPQEHISKTELEAFLDRFEGLEDEATEIMMTAMAACKNGPRAAQKELKDEMKERGVRLKTFGAMWAVRRAQRMGDEKVAALEDDDRDQLKMFAQAMKDTPFGEYIAQRLDDAVFS